MNADIVRVKAEDISYLADLADEIWHEFFTCILSRAQIDYMVGKFQSESAMRAQLEDGYEYFFIQSEGKTVGYIGLRDEGGKIFLSKLYLKKDFRGRGLASVAFAFIERLCRERGASELYLTVNRHNEGAIAVYKAKGMNIIREQVSDIGNGFVMDDYVFSKSFSGSSFEK